MPLAPRRTRLRNSFIFRPDNDPGSRRQMNLQSPKLHNVSAIVPFKQANQKGHDAGEVGYETRPTNWLETASGREKTASPFISLLDTDHLCPSASAPFGRFHPKFAPHKGERADSRAHQADGEQRQQAVGTTWCLAQINGPLIHVTVADCLPGETNPTLDQDPKIIHNRELSNHKVDISK